jgi:membrane protein required for colicin V production
MLVYDLIMIAVLIAATAWGVYKGLAWQIASLASIFVSYVGAANFCGLLAPYIGAQPPWNVYLAMLIIYLGASLAVWIAFRLVKTTIDGVKLQEFDKHVGGVFGAAKGVVLCVIITLFGVTLMGQRERESIVRSYSGYYIAVLLDKSHAVIPTAVHDQIHPLLHKLDESLPPGYQPAHDHGQPYAPPGPNRPYPPTGNQPYRFGQGSGNNDLFDLR